MTIQEFRDYMASGKPVTGGSDVHMMFHQLSQEALKIQEFRDYMASGVCRPTA